MTYEKEKYACKVFVCKMSLEEIIGRSEYRWGDSIKKGVGERVREPLPVPVYNHWY